jgi:cysteine synthase
MTETDARIGSGIRGHREAGCTAAAAQSLPHAAVVVTVFPDRMERYFSTELFAPYCER